MSIIRNWRLEEVGRSAEKKGEFDAVNTGQPHQDPVWKEERNDTSMQNSRMKSCRMTVN